ncbi:hypothetical protein PtB15_5B485 [Puccinia triticina]|nr:hypothetical protein PtB15_5B485 [Puccinia triticina]
MGSISRRLNQLSAQLDHRNHNIRPATSLAQPALRPSASLIIIQPLQSTTPDGYNYRTLLMQRNSTQRSFPAAHVFPGGNLDPDDHNYQSLLNHPVSKDTSGEPSELQTTLKLCAIRETFEEAGILVGLSPGVDTPSSVLTDFRLKLKEKSTEFNSIAQHIQAHVPSAQNIQGNLFNFDGLAHYGNILTPTTSPKRWDTQFYLSILPSPSESTTTQDDLHVATPDESETVSVVWLSPAEALKRSVMAPSERSDSITLPPPQFYLLTDLARWKDYRQLRNYTKRKVFPITPEIVKQKSEGTATFVVVFPGDPLHSTSKELCKNASVDQQSIIHRIHVRHEATNFGSQPGNFFRPMRLQRSGMYQIFGSGWEDLD